MTTRKIFGILNILNKIKNIVEGDRKGGMAMDPQEELTDICSAIFLYGPGIPQEPGHNFSA